MKYMKYVALIALALMFPGIALIGLIFYAIAKMPARGY
jgi:hypothetical protein